MNVATLPSPAPQPSPPADGARKQRWQRWQQALLSHASPRQAHALAGRTVPWALAVAWLATLAGLYVGFFVAPTDHQQGEAYRIIFVHVPAAWLSMLLYVAMAFWSAVGWVFNTRVSSLLARAIAPTGALFTFLALWTGALWGKPTWGTWWVWDARLTSELLLLFLYLGVIGLQSAIDDPRRGDQAGALLAVNPFHVWLSRTARSPSVKATQPTAASCAMPSHAAKRPKAAGA